jgi:hypothetical protein
MSKKGKAKNTKNKAKHSKLMVQKNNKLKKTKIAHKERIKELVKNLHKQNKKVDESKLIK